VTKGKKKTEREVEKVTAKKKKTKAPDEP